MTPTATSRRPIKARDTRWAAATAAALVKLGFKPNQISVLSAVSGALAGVCLVLTTRSGAVGAAVFFVASALFVQLRLLCNLFDGMVAIEGGFKTKSGEVFNELPDRFADAFVLIGCGWAAHSLPYGMTLGWVATALALLTAYVRAMGAGAGAGQCFLGPMAKQHRMAVVTGAVIAAAAAGFYNYQAHVIYAALVVIVVGATITVARRTLWVVRTLEAKTS
jgi:phosphatidylglycerophosphate synthase